MNRLRDDAGFSLLEMVIAVGLGSIVSLVIASSLNSQVRVEAFGTSQSITLDALRLSLDKLSAELRGADFVTWCAPTNECLQAGTRSLNGTFGTARYTVSGTTLVRETLSGVDWVDPQTLVTGLTNSNVFSCDATQTLVAVGVHLIVNATPVSNPTIDLQATIRPRNFSTTVVCP